MAELIDLDKKNKFLLRPTRYEQREEFWFSADLNLIQKDQPILKGTGSFHINDFLSLVAGIQHVVGKKTDKFEFNPIEPYLKIDIELINNNFFVEVCFCKGPIFTSSEYKKITLIVSSDNLIKFADQIQIDLKMLDSKLKLKSVDL